MYNSNKDWIKYDTEPVHAVNALCPNCLGKECDYCDYFGTVMIDGGTYEFCPNIQRSVTQEEYIAVFRDSHYLKFLWCLIGGYNIIERQMM